MQETRLWDSAAGVTVSMRSKEEAHDYRYFPEPDLPPVVVDAARVAAIRAAMPELPDARRRRFVDGLRLPEYDAAQLTQSRALSDYFERGRAPVRAPKAASNWMMGELARALNDGGRRDRARRPCRRERLAGLDRADRGGHDQRRHGERRVREDVRLGTRADEIVARRGAHADRRRSADRSRSIAAC